MSSLPPSEFVQQQVIAEADSVRLLGCRENAQLIVELHSRRCATRRPVNVLLGNPNWSPGKEDRTDAVFHCMMGQEESPSVGGWHQLTEKDYVTFALIAEFERAGRRLTSLVERFLRVHPAWPVLSFLPDLNKVAACRLLTTIVDPRWHVDPHKPDRDARLRSSLGLGGNGLEVVKSILTGSRGLTPSVAGAVAFAEDVLDTWTGGDYTPPPQDVVGPAGFLWRVYYGVAAAKDGHRGMLRACHVFLRFLRSVWLDSLTEPRLYESVVRRVVNRPRGKPDCSERRLRMLPCRAGSSILFLPEHFFRLTAEVEAWRQHLARCSGRTA